MPGNLPPGASGDPNAPWNRPDPPTCPECERIIGTVDDHEDGCEMADADQQDIAEYYQETNRKDYDDVKDEQIPSDVPETDMVIPEQESDDE